MVGGPPCSRPNENSVRQPDRIEMMVKEMAKFENRLMERLSSWA